MTAIGRARRFRGPGERPESAQPCRCRVSGEGPFTESTAAARVGGKNRELLATG
jgi:hypothetical protein